MTGKEAEPPRTVDEIYKDLAARRFGLIKALTQDVDEFYRQCDPEKENLCLYGNADKSWEVALPVDEVPPELPEPALGINFARDGMQKKDWLKLVAVHSDAWLLAVAFFYGAKLTRSERDKLFKLINQSATVFETLSGKDTSGKGNKRGASGGLQDPTEVEVSALKGRRFEVLWEDGQKYTGIIKTVNKRKMSLYVQYDNEDGSSEEIQFDPDLPIEGPDGFYEGGYRLLR